LPRHGCFDPSEVEYIAADITDQSSLERAFVGAEEVYHLAGLLRTSELDSSMRESINTNILGTLNVLEASRRSGVRSVFYASKVHVWLNSYTISKHAAEQFSRLFTRQYPVRVTCLRYFNMFGPKQKLYPVRKLIPTLAAQAIRKLPLQVFGDGEQTVDMIYAKDAARITVDYSRKGYVDRAMDCGSGAELTVNSIAKLVNTYFHNAAGIQHIPMRKGESPNSTIKADIKPLEQLLGPIKLTAYETAMEETLKYYASLDEHTIDAALAFHGIDQPLGVSWS